MNSHLKLMIGDKKLSEGMIVSGKGWCEPAQQGLAWVFNVNAAYGLCTVAHQQQWRAEPHMAILAVHIAPPGTSVGMPRVVARLYGGVEGGVVPK